MAKILSSILATSALMVFVCSSTTTTKTYTETCDGLEAVTDKGLVCGKEREYDVYEPETETWKTIRYASFRGIPYAAPPLGERRFQELLPAEPWSLYLNATVEGPNCYQYDYLVSSLSEPHGMSEDCITANVHVPIDTTLSDHHCHSIQGKRMPIMVFIHGGGFQLGSGDSDIYGPEYMINQGVVVITFNYRLGPFGFLSLNTAEVPGNAGLRDMVTLLKWVQKNGANFGGDINDVTIVGQSAGSSAVHLLALSNATKGLFHRIVMMSGSGVRSFYSPKFAANSAMAQPFFDLLNITSTDTKEIYKQLITVSPEAITSAQKILLEQNSLTVFLPIVESAFEGVTRVVDDDPEVLLSQGRDKDFPTIISFTVGECQTFKPRFDEVHVDQKFIQNSNLGVPPVLLFSKTDNQLTDIKKKIHDRYFANNDTTLDNYVKFCSEALFIYPAFYTAQKRAEIGGAPVHFYQFNYQGQYRALDNPRYKFTEPAHAEDILYIMKIDSTKLRFTQKMIDVSLDGAMQRMMQKGMNNFIRTGSPVLRSDSESWPVYTANNKVYQDIREPKSVVSNFTQEQQQMIQFYTDIYG